MIRCLTAIAFLGAGCKGGPDAEAAPPAPGPPADGRTIEPPVPLNAEVPIPYPEALAARQIGGTVILQVFVDTAGLVVAESTRVRESSGYPALDSAAVRGSRRLRYAPALAGGTAVASPFLQPIHFRTSSGSLKP